MVDKKFDGFPPRENNESITRIPDSFIDEDMKSLTPGERSIMLVLFREGSNAVSQKQFMEYLSLSRNCIKKSIKNLIKRGYIKKIKKHNSKKQSPSQYVNIYSNEKFPKYNQSLKIPSKMKGVNGFVYLLKGDNLYKIGATTNLKQRLKDIKYKNDFDINLVSHIQTKDMFVLEKYLHNKFSEKRKKYEWFELNKEDVDFIKSLNSENVSNIIDGEGVA